MSLKAKMIVDIIRWSLERQGIQVYIEHKGDSDAGAIFIKHDKGGGLYDVYHRVNDNNIGKKIQFLKTFKEENLNIFFKKQTDIDGDLWLIEVVSKGFDLHSLFLKQDL
ncbi:MAG: hypothetical protein CML36_03165 [Rhodobacteraceae bacterium]|nr:hypothetical protein [Paracoccaceae bacterium]|tara:strand:+ start:113 stop:439 length:327 start_codon:yes stop_codon:yes gene_type:complete